jgi:AcrR family transcriptional regulator
MTQVGASRPGGRTARTRALVRDAVQAELAEHGYPGLTMEGVAERSGVHKTTLYRRWGGVDGLVVDALDLTVADSWAPADTGSLAGDLTAITREVAATFADPVLGPSSHAFIVASFHSTRAADALRAVFADRLRRSAVVVARAVSRGELPADVDADALLRTALAPLYFRQLIMGEPMDYEVADQAAAGAVAAALAGVFG